MGSSLVKNNFVDTAKEVMSKADKLGKEIVLPVDVVIGDKFDKDADAKIGAANEIPNGWAGLDNVGPKMTEQMQKESLADCETITMNGPMGAFEFETFAKEPLMWSRSWPI